MYDLTSLDARKQLVDDLSVYVAEHYEQPFNIFVFGSFLTEDFVPGKSDLDIAVYTTGSYMVLDDVIDEFLGKVDIKYDTIIINPNSRVNLIDIAPLTGYRTTDWFPYELKKHLSQLAFYRMRKKEDLIRYNRFYQRALERGVDSHGETVS